MLYIQGFMKRIKIIIIRLSRKYNCLSEFTKFITFLTFKALTIAMWVLQLYDI